MWLLQLPSLVSASDRDVVIIHAGVPVAQHRLLPQGMAGLAPCLTVGLLVVLLASDAVRPVPSVLYGLAVFLGGTQLVIGWIDRRLQMASGYRWFVVAAPLVIVGADVALDVVVLVPPHAARVRMTINKPTKRLHFPICVMNWILRD